MLTNNAASNNMVSPQAYGSNAFGGCFTKCVQQQQQMDKHNAAAAAYAKLLAPPPPHADTSDESGISDNAHDFEESVCL